MTSDHNRSELGIQDHSNEPSSSKLVPKVVPLAVKTATSRQELELLFHLHIAMLRTTDNDNDKSSKSRSQRHEEQITTKKKQRTLRAKRQKQSPDLHKEWSLHEIPSGELWVPTGKTFASSTTKVESEPPNGSNADITNQCESKQALNVSAGTLLSTAVQASVVNVKWCLLKITLQAPFLNDKMMSVHISSGLVLHQMTSDHNRSELGIQDHSNEPSSSKLVPKVVPLAVKTATSRQELELLFHHHIAMLRTTVKTSPSRQIVGITNPSSYKPMSEDKRLVAQGYNQQEGIDYDETYAPVSRLESIRILLAYACALDFKLFQMNIKSAFLYGFINEEVYVAQPLGFIDFEKPDHVYKLKKALYDLKQAPKAWYDRLKSFLIKHEYKIGMVDNTLFTKKKSSNLIIVQIYVDDIIFGSTCQDMCDEFSKIMHDEFEISMMDELNFFLGLQIKQIEDGIFFNQSKYIKEMLKKFGLEESKQMKTHVSSDTKLTKDEECESVDSTKYRGMIGSLLYLTASRPDIMFSVCLCACFQGAPKTSHLEAVKRIFRYIKGTMHLRLWYPKGTDIEIVVYADSDHAGDYVDRKSTSGIFMFVGCCLTSWFSKKQIALAIFTTKAEYVSAGKACQQVLWMKQALIDYDVRLDDVPIMCIKA
ncbi:retrovirus-related pol polyprotein from transposon TNT 1-94 [Tanacetum coccineum]|uniref:Retrovirus-related pol polyprotein from transposon TNT 1-94 n=1 Tax=Tanacetum coccineum TaxID=301880 RepID=A0ABQ5DW26_9ASTR